MGMRGIYIGTIIFKRWRGVRAVLFQAVIVPPGSLYVPLAERSFVCISSLLYVCVFCVTLCMCISFLAYLYFYPHLQNLSGLPASRDKTVCSLAWPIRKNLLCKYCQVKLLSNTFFTLVKFFWNWKVNLVWGGKPQKVKLVVACWKMLRSPPKSRP